MGTAYISLPVLVGIFAQVTLERLSLAAESRPKFLMFVFERFDDVLNCLALKYLFVAFCGSLQLFVRGRWIERCFEYGDSVALA